MLLPKCLSECQDSRRAQWVRFPAVTCHYRGRTHRWSFKPAPLIRPLMELTSKGTSQWLGFHKDGEQKSCHPPPPLLLFSCESAIALSWPHSGHSSTHSPKVFVLIPEEHASLPNTQPPSRPLSQSCLVICMGSDSPTHFLKISQVLHELLPL